MQKVSITSLTKAVAAKATWAADRERDKVPRLGVRCRNACNYILNYLTKQLATNPDTDSDADGDTAVDSDPEEYEKSKADQQI